MAIIYLSEQEMSRKSQDGYGPDALSVLGGFELLNDRADALAGKGQGVHDGSADEWRVRENKFEMHFKVPPHGGSVQGDTHKGDLAGLVWRRLPEMSINSEWTPVVLSE
jgi:hypothetical protein